MTSDQINQFQKNGKIKINVEGTEKVLTSDEIVIKVVPAEGFTAAADNLIKVAIELRLDERLQAEGFARELVNRIQNMRKNAGLEVTDRIKLGISHSSQSEMAVKMFGQYIKNETLAVEIDDKVDRDIKQQWKINGMDTIITLEKV